VLLLFLLLARATGLRGRSMIVAALFALHPLNVESVAWAAELKNVLCSLFFLLAVCAYGWYVQKPSVSRYTTVAALFLLGLASKPMVITFPFVLLLLDFWPLGRIEGWGSPSALLPAAQKSFAALVLEKLPMLPLCIGSAIVTYLAEHSVNAEKFISVSLPLRVENAIYSYAMYVWNAFWPSGLAVFYPHPSGSLAPWRLEVAAFFLIAVSVLVWRESREHGYLLAGWLWYLGMLVPVIGLVQVGGQARADRYTYLPLIGVFVMAVWGLGDFAQQRKWSPAAQRATALLVLAALVMTARKQISYWENSYELWTRALDVTRDNQIAEHNLANELVRLHRDPEAIPHLQRAVEFNPQDMVSAANLGAALSKTGRHEDAVREYEIVLRRSSDPKILLGVYYNLSIEYHLVGNDTEAAECHRQFLQEVNKLGMAWPSGLNGGSG
jgi:protein O-mannosyl-transferase